MSEALGKMMSETKMRERPGFKKKSFSIDGTMRFFNDFE